MTGEAHNPTGRVWLITGASRGLGREFAQAALEAGDTVVLTARDPTALEPLADRHPDATLALELDVTDRAAAARVVARATERFGRIDVAVNCAGYGLHAAIEETTEAEAREQMETNFFGALW
jgi:NAD(P)-dependent dehydrogenase (short-subunit alcohol dehydrogenase family)